MQSPRMRSRSTTDTAAWALTPVSVPVRVFMSPVMYVLTAVRAGGRAAMAAAAAAVAMGAFNAFAASGDPWADAPGAMCLDERMPPASEAQETALPAPEPLAALVQAAFDRSQRIDARRLLRDAAADDVRSEQAARETRLHVDATLGPAWRQWGRLSQTSPLQLQAGVVLSRLLHDGGHTEHRIEWREHLRLAAARDLLSEREQIALRTVAATLERVRLRQQVITLGQYVRQMGCLVQALDHPPASASPPARIVTEARLALAQALELQRRARRALRDSAPALRHLIGDGLPLSIELPLWLWPAGIEPRTHDEMDAPALAALQARQAAEQARAQALARAGQPQVHGFIGARAGAAPGANTAAGRGSAELSMGLNIRFDLGSGGRSADPAATSAAEQRAEAARLDLEAARAAHRLRLQDSVRQAQQAFESAQQLAALLRDSGRLRQPTLQEWQDSDTASLDEAVNALRVHFALRTAYLDALHAGQQSTVLVKSLTQGLAEALR